MFIKNDKYHEASQSSAAQRLFRYAALDACADTAVPTRWCHRQHQVGCWAYWLNRGCTLAGKLAPVAWARSSSCQ